MLELRQYVPNGRVSTGLLAWRNGRLVWAIGQRKYWRTEADCTVIPLIGIGGGQEEGETLIAAVQREALEEACARIAVRGAAATLWINVDAGTVARPDLDAALAGEPAPLLIWQARVTLRRDDGSPRETDYINPVYEAELLDEPRPGAETPGLLDLMPGQFLTLRDRPRPLAELLQGGARYVGAALPGDSVIALQGSALFTARYWEQLRPFTR